MTPDITKARPTAIERPTEFFQDSEAHLTQPIHTQKDLTMSTRKFANILKFITASFLLLPASCFLKPQVALAYGNFSATCDDIRFYENNDPTLYAHCRRGDNSVNGLSRINLNDYVGNSNGMLVWQINGGFNSSCQERKILTVNGARAIFDAVCKDRNNKLQHTQLVLDQCLTNQDGVLKYVDGCQP